MHATLTLGDRSCPFQENYIRIYICFNAKSGLATKKNKYSEVKNVESNEE